jgi:hypothetical protein
MALQADKTRDRRNAASIAAEARELFGEWAAEEEAGYRGEVPWRSSSGTSTPKGPPTTNLSESPRSSWPA